MPRPRPIIEIEKDGVKVRIYEQELLDKMDIHAFFGKLTGRREEETSRVILEAVQILKDFPEAKERLAEVMKKYEDTLKRLGIHSEVWAILEEKVTITESKTEKKARRGGEPATTKQINYIKFLLSKLAKAAGLQKETVISMAEEDLGFDIHGRLTQLTKDEASKLIYWLEDRIKEEGVEEEVRKAVKVGSVEWVEEKLEKDGYVFAEDVEGNKEVTEYLQSREDVVYEVGEGVYLRKDLFEKYAERVEATDEWECKVCGKRYRYIYQLIKHALVEHE